MNLIKSTETIEVHTYFLNGEGPYKSIQDALESCLVDNHTCYSDQHLDTASLFADKELLIAMGEWAKRSIPNE